MEYIYKVNWMMKKTIPKLWKWSQFTSMSFEIFLSGTDDVPHQIRKWISIELQKALIKRAVEIELEATKDGIMYDTNDSDASFFMTEEEARQYLEEVWEELGITKGDSFEGQ